jgi:hypothetical protein
MGASVALGAALHPRKQPRATQPPASGPAPIEITAPKSQRPPCKSVPRTPAALPPPRDPDLEHVSLFLKHAVFRPDPEGQASLKYCATATSGWCQSSELAPLAPAAFGKHLRSIIDAIGLECEAKHGDMIIHGATIH